MPVRQWFLKLDGEVLGPLDDGELLRLAKMGSVRSETPVSSDGTVWKPAAVVEGLEFGQTISQPTRASTAGIEGRGGKVGWIVAGVLAAVGLPVMGLLGLVLLGLMAGDSRVDSQADGVTERTAHYPPVTEDATDKVRTVDNRTSNQPVAEVARLNLSWVDATSELLPLAKSLTPAQRATIGMAVLASGADVYAVRVSLSNTGNVPVRVFPQNLGIHFGNETAAVYTMDDYRFLRPGVLQPGKTTSGLVTYTARMDIGAAIRSGGGQMSYTDPTIRVTFE